MTLLVQIVLPLAGLVCLALVPLGLPGTWIMLLLAALAEWVTGPRLFSFEAVVAMLVLAGLGELWEFSASAVRAKRAGAGRGGTLGALVGGIGGALVGTFVLPVPLVGSLLGGGLGALAGSMLLESRNGRPMVESWRIGRAAAVGHMLGIVGKFALGGIVWIVLTIALIR